MQDDASTVTATGGEQSGSVAKVPGVAFRPGQHRDIVLVGAGHTHLLVMKQLIAQPMTGARITLVSSAASLWYSGMLPQVVSGNMQPAEIRVNAARLAKLARARLVVEAVTGIDLAAKTLRFADRPSMPFDLLSLNLGAESALPPIIENHNAPQGVPQLLPVKPLGAFLQAWQQLKDFLDTHKKRMEIAIVGGGVASIELALAIRAYQRACRPSMLLHIHLVTRADRVAGELPNLARESLRLELLLAHITVHLNFTATHLGAGGVFGENGTRLPVDAVIWATQVKPPDWCQSAGFTCDAQGFISVGPTLQSISHPNIFVVGDLAHFTPKPLPKAGVYAVRHAKVLYENLKRLTHSTIGAKNKSSDDVPQTPDLVCFRPQRDFLKILNLGNNKGLLCRNGFVYTGRLALRLKVHLDKQFLAGLAQPPGANVALPLAAPRFEMLRAPVQVGRPSATTSIAVTPLIWGDLFRLGRHATLWSLARVLGQSMTPHTLRAYLTLPVMASPLATHDVELVAQGILKVLQDEALNPQRVTLASLSVRQGTYCLLETRLEGAVRSGKVVRGVTIGASAEDAQGHGVGSAAVQRVVQGVARDWVSGVTLNDGVNTQKISLADSPYAVLCTHPLGAGYWGRAALAGELCATAWTAMTEACFQQVANWWQVLQRLMDDGLICSLCLIEADGLVPAIARMLADDVWHLSIALDTVSLLPDLVDPALAAEKKTLYQAHPAVEDNFWHLQCEFDIRPSVGALHEWPRAFRALVDANVGLSWAVLVKPEHESEVLSKLHAASLPNAFCLGGVKVGEPPSISENTLKASRAVQQVVLTRKAGGLK